MSDGLTLSPSGSDRTTNSNVAGRTYDPDSAHVQILRRTNANSRLEFDVPVQPGSPAVWNIFERVHAERRNGERLGLHRCIEQAHSRLFRRAIAFPRVAWVTAHDDVFPYRASTTITRDHVIVIELGHCSLLAA